MLKINKLLLAVGMMGLGFALAYLPDRISPPPILVTIICWLIYGVIFFYYK